MCISNEHLGQIAMKTWIIYDGNIYLFIFFYLAEIAIWLISDPWYYISAPCAKQNLHGSLLCAEQSLPCSLTFA